MRDFRNLLVWERAHRFTLDLYRQTERLPKHEVFGLSSQLRRAASSIPTNLAEGCGRWGDGDMGRFIQIAVGSASEVEYLLLLAKDLGYFEPVGYETLAAKLEEIRKMLTAFYKRVRQVPQAQTAKRLAKS